MPSIFTPLVATPTPYKTVQLGIPTSGNLQILKYIADFSNLAAGLFTYTLMPNSQQTFGCARMVKIDARNLLMPVTFAISDSLSDFITIMPGDYAVYHLDGSSSDTYTVTSDFVSNGSSGTNQFGYVKFYFYNYIDLSAIEIRAKQSMQVTSFCTAPSTFPGITISQIAPGKGMPIIEQIVMTTDFTNAGVRPYVWMTHSVPASTGWVGPDIWYLFYTSGVASSLVFEPNILIPPSNAAVTPENESISGAYFWTFQPGVDTVPSAGNAEIFIRYRFN